MIITNGYFHAAVPPNRISVFHGKLIWELQKDSLQLFTELYN